MQLILRGKRLGFSLSDIRQFLELYDADRSKHRQMAMTLSRTRARITELEQQLEDITVTLAELRDMEADIVAYQHASATTENEAGNPPAAPKTQRSAQT